LKRNSCELIFADALLLAFCCILVHQNLNATAQGSVVIGAFDDKAVKGLLQIAEGEEPLYIIPVGKE